jgi:PAS domain S-box-containing protein
MIREEEQLILAGAEQPLSDYQTMFFANGRSNSPIQEALLQPSLRQNWAQLALRGLPDFLHVVSQDGRIRYVSKSCETVVGHERAQLIGHVVHNFIHPDDLEIFTIELTHLIKCGVPTRFIYRFRAPGHRWIILESQCNIYLDPSCVSDCRDVIIMARPYSIKTNFWVDSYLEHKIAHETLTRQKAHLENESDDEDSETESEVDESDTGVVDGVFVSYLQPQRFRCQSSSTKPQAQVEIAYFKSQGQVDNSTSVGDEHTILSISPTDSCTRARKHSPHQTGPR